MLEESDGYSYQGQVFASREAMELFIASRAPVDVRKVRVPPTKDAAFGWIAAGCAMLVLGMCSAMFHADKPSAPGGYAAPAPGSVALDDEIKQKAALVINLSGQLCANVTAMTHLQGDVYSVACMRYRDGTGAATYEMNVVTGAVR
jgi:hypothetical protein